MALLVALSAIVLVELSVWGSAASFMETNALLYRTKLRMIEERGDWDVVFLGDSSSVAGIRPSSLEPALPAGTRVLNLALPAVGPIGGELALRRYLEHHAPPRLLVLNYTPLIQTEWRINFVKYPLRFLLDARELLLASRAQGDLGYVGDWAASRLPSLRYREDLRDVARTTGPRIESSDPGQGFALAWGHTRRPERNRRTAAGLVHSQGWHFFEELALPGAVLPDDVHYDREEFIVAPFVASPREESALVRLLDLCRSRSIPVLVLPAAQPRAMVAAQLREGGRARLEAFGRRMFGDRPGVRAEWGWVLPRPHGDFADKGHLNAAGLESYTRFIRPILRETLAGG